MLSSLVLDNRLFWKNRNMDYYVVYNRHTPRFSPEVSVRKLIQRAQQEYELIEITLNLTFAGMLYNTNHQTFDGKNTVSVSPDVTPGETHFYSTQLYKRIG